MVLCNIIVTQVALKNYSINVFGRKHVRVCSISYLETDAAYAVNKLICIKSNILRFPFGTNNNITFSNQNAHQVLNICSDMEMVCDFNGNVDIELVDLRAGDAQGNFQIMSLMLDIKDIPNPPLPEQHYKHDFAEHKESHHNKKK
jgi:hypothetical protein